MLLNKWISFGLSAVGGLAALASSLNWSAVTSPTTSAGIATGILVLKGILNAVQPAAGQTAIPTGGSVFTHK